MLNTVNSIKRFTNKLKKFTFILHALDNPDCLSFPFCVQLMCVFVFVCVLCISKEFPHLKDLKHTTNMTQRYNNNRTHATCIQPNTTKLKKKTIIRYSCLSCCNVCIILFKFKCECVSFVFFYIVRITQTKWELKIRSCSRVYFFFFFKVSKSDMYTYAKCKWNQYTKKWRKHP